MIMSYSDQFKIGASALLSKRFGIAATLTPGATLDKKGSYYYKRDAYRNTAVDSINTAIKEDYKLPTQIRFALYTLLVMLCALNSIWI